MIWSHQKKLMDMALQAINRPRPYRPLKVVPHDPTRNPAFVRRIKGWITSEIFLINKSPEDMEVMLGFDSRRGQEYLKSGIDIFEFDRPIESDDLDLLTGSYTYLPGGNPWDGVDLKWPPGTGAPQWRLKTEVPCRLLKTVPRGQRFF